MALATPKSTLLDKIRSLPEERLAEVEDFVDRLRRHEERRARDAAAKLSEDAFASVWDNEDDAVYDQL